MTCIDMINEEKIRSSNEYKLFTEEFDVSLTDNEYDDENMKQDEYDLDRVKTNLEFLIERYSCDHPIGNLARSMLALLHEYKRALPIMLAEDLIEA